MAVQPQANNISYATDGVSTAYNVPFYFSEQPDLIVTYSDPEGDPPVTLVLNSDYTVSGVVDPKLGTYSAGGVVTTTSVLAAGGTLLIVRSTPESQPYVWNPGDPFPSGTTEAAHDREMLCLQDLAQAFQVVGIALGPPSSGSYSNGNIIMNKNPQPGGTAGWIYIFGLWYELFPISGTAA
jgi:hypothetical protein